MTTFEERLNHTLSSAYIIERELGGGGMSRVFVATDRMLGRKIVIKVLSPELTAEMNRGRFRREIQVAAQLQHPHIVPLLSAGEQDDLLYFTMPFIKGESLKTALEKDGRISIAEVLRVLNHVCEALDYAHEAGIIHRDIKPANILRSGSYALVTDFGVAKALNAAMPSSQGITATGMAIGTPRYMAPEQLAGDAAADHRIDIYAVGLLAYELLNGKSPFAGTTPQRMLAAVLTEEPRPLIDVRPDVPQFLSDIVMSCLSKEPNQRPATARELLNSLEMFASSSGELRSIELRVPHIVHTPTPTSGITPVVTAEVVAPAAESPREQPTFNEEEEERYVSPPLTAAELDAIGYADRKKSRTRLYGGIVAVLAAITMGGFWMSQRDSSGVNAAATGEPPIGSPIGDTTSVQSPVPESSMVAVVPTIDSQAVRDSIRRAVRRDSTRKALAKAKADSLQKAQAVSVTPVSKARQAAAAMFANSSALAAFTKGATHMGGVLNSKRKGDLQTQIDALQPFLSQAGLSYAQFKEIVGGAGVQMFDEFGRIVPAALRRFAEGH